MNNILIKLPAARKNKKKFSWQKELARPEITANLSA
jgi:hypothetical protein